jgi:type II secretory pathway pseudopilin PulG
MEELKLKKNLNNKKGFTFIETLVSITILSFIVIGVLTMTSVHIKMNSFALHHTKAVQLAEEGVEMLLRLDPTLLPGYYTPGQTEDFGTIMKYPDYSRTITVSQIDMDNYRIACSVIWKSQRLNSKPLVLSILRTL